MRLAHELRIVWTFLSGWRNTRRRTIFYDTGKYIKLIFQNPQIRLSENKAMLPLLHVSVAAFVLQGRVESSWHGLYVPQSWTHWLSGPLQKMLASSGSRWQFIPKPASASRVQIIYFHFGSAVTGRRGEFDVGLFFTQLTLPFQNKLIQRLRSSLKFYFQLETHTASNLGLQPLS